MKLLNGQGEGSRARRSARLQILRVREFALIAGLFAIVAALGFAGYHNTSLKKIGLAAAARGLAVTADAGFKVKDILVTGRSKIPAADLLTHLSIKRDMPIFGVNIAEAQKSLAGLSWVKDVSISRRLPDKIVVDLKERVPAALWQYKKKISVIDREGVVLASDDLSDYKSLPLAVGQDAAQHVAELLGFLDAVPVIANQLDSAARTGSRRWDLRLKNGIAVKLPEQDAELALSYLGTLEEQKHILDKAIVSIDLRLPEKMVVTPENG